MKIMFLVAALMAGSINYAFSQTYKDEIKWKLGDSKECKLDIHALQAHFGATTMDTSMYVFVEFEVVDEDDSTYYISATSDNAVYNIASKYYPQIGIEMPLDSLIESDIIINKYDLRIDYADKEAYINELISTAAEIEAFLDEKEDSAYIAQIQKETKELIDEIRKDSSASAEIGSIFVLELILDSYRTTYSFTDTLVLSDSLFNPLKVQGIGGGISRVYTRGKQRSRSYNVIKETHFNTDIFKQLTDELSDGMGNMMGGMAKASGNLAGLEEPVSSPEEMADQMKSLFAMMLKNMNIVIYEEINVEKRKKSNYPLRIVSKLDINMNSQGGAKNIIIDSDLVIN